MNILSKLFSYVTVATCLLLSDAAFSQEMPQDSWRSVGQFSSGDSSDIFYGSIAANETSIFATVLRVPGIINVVYSGDGSVDSNTVTLYGTYPYFQSILRFSQNGNVQTRFGEFGQIRGMAWGPNGRLYVMDSANLMRPNNHTPLRQLIQVFDANGDPKGDWGDAGSDNGKFGVIGTTIYPTLSGGIPGGGLSMIATDKDGYVYVCDPGNGRVQVFTSSGSFVRKWGERGNLPGQFPTNEPSSIAVSNDGRVFCGGKIFDKNGAYIDTSPNGLEVFAASPDGLGLYDMGGTGYAFSSTGSRISIGNPSPKTATFSNRGDLFFVRGNSISHYLREYASSKNFPNTAALPQPVVVSSAQRTGTSWMDIDYLVTDADSPTVTTGLLAFKNGGSALQDAIVMNTFMEGTSTNVGTNQPTGTTLHATWNIAADWAVDYANIQVEALAKDSRNLLGVHWITVPASNDEPATQVSSQPIAEETLLDIWYWLLATHQGVTLTNGIVSGTSGPYTGQQLVNYPPPSYNSTSTSAGRLFAFGQMGARPINGSELARAKAGNYGFTSVDKNSVVKISGTVTTYLRGFGDSNFGQASWSSFSGSGPTQVSCGDGHSAFIKADGTLWTQGNNDSGQLGDGTHQNSFSPARVATSVVFVAAGGNHTLFIKSDGTLWAMGSNYYGQLGDGTTINRNIPVQIATGVTQASAGGNSSLFLKSDGTLWAMGYNSEGQLGTGDNKAQSAPIQVATGVAKISMGSSHGLFIKMNGTLWAMGNNSYGQLGDGSNSQHNTPVQIATGVSQASAGRNAGNSYSLFVKTDGTLWATGYNGYGQLGDGTTTIRYTPVQVATGVNLASAGSNHSMFLKTNGSVWAMGYDGSGELGDGSTLQRNTPVSIASNATAIGAGASYSLIVTIVPQ